MFSENIGQQIQQINQPSTINGTDDLISKAQPPVVKQERFGAGWIDVHGDCGRQIVAMWVICDLYMWLIYVSDINVGYVSWNMFQI
jgi:hypothetical protein